MSLKLVAMLLLVPACLRDNAGECPTQTGPGVSGMVRYTTGDGTILAEELSASLRMTEADAVVLTGRLDDEWGRRRDFRVELHALGPGMFDLAGHGSLCMPRLSGGDDVCSPVTGSIDVRQLESECYTYDNGISECLFQIDLTLHGISVWEGTTFEIDANELTVGEYAPCDV